MVVGGAATYDEYVGLVLNAPRVRVQRLLDEVDARRIAGGAATVPDEWFDLVAGSREEASRWRTAEWKRSLPPPGG